MGVGVGAGAGAGAGGKWAANTGGKISVQVIMGVRQEQKGPRVIFQILRRVLCSLIVFNGQCYAKFKKKCKPAVRQFHSRSYEGRELAQTATFQEKLR